MKKNKRENQSSRMKKGYRLGRKVEFGKRVLNGTKRKPAKERSLGIEGWVKLTTSLLHFIVVLLQVWRR